MAVRLGFRDLAWRKYLGRCGLDLTASCRVKMTMRRLRGLENRKMRILVLLPRSPALRLSAVRRPCRTCTVPIRRLGASLFLVLLRAITRPVSMRRTRRLNNSAVDHHWIRRGLLGLDGEALRNLLHRLKATTILEDQHSILHWLAINPPRRRHRTCLLHPWRKICRRRHHHRPHQTRCRHLPLTDRRISLRISLRISPRTSHPCTLLMRMRSRLETKV